MNKINLSIRLFRLFVAIAFVLNLCAENGFAQAVPDPWDENKQSTSLRGAENLGRVKQLMSESVSLEQGNPLSINTSMLALPDYPKCINCFTNPEIELRDPVPSKSMESESFISSPFNNLRETMGSKKFTAGIYADELVKSDLALTTATWAMVEPAFFSALTAAGNTAISMSQNRYLADQAIRSVFNSNKETGEILTQNYEACIGKLSQQYSYAAAQEICMGGFDNRFVEARDLGANDGIAKAKRFTFEYLPAKQVASQAWASPNPDMITLSDLIFNVPIVSARNEADKNYIFRLKNSWLQIIGDVEYRVLDRTNVSEKSMKINLSKVLGSFQYPESTLLDPAFANQVNSRIQQGELSAFKIFMRYKSDTTYYNLVRMMFKRCRFNNSEFWNPVNGNVENRVNLSEVSALSTRSFTFNRLVGDYLFNLYSGISPTCDDLNPNGADRKIFSLPTVLTRSRDGVIDQYSPVINFYYRFAEAIAASQINEMLNELRKFVHNISGGAFESKARDAALKLIDESAGTEWNYMEARSRIDAEIYFLQNTLKEHSFIDQNPGSKQVSEGGR